MAVAKEFQNRKLGRFVLFAALYEAWRATKHVSSFAVVVDAKTEGVVPFYERHGFRRLEGNRLIMAMKTIEGVVGESERATTTSAAPPAAPPPPE
jgi:GNAT superfamily N-acetyltransferase